MTIKGLNPGSRFRRTGQKVRKYSQEAGYCEGNFWRSFNGKDSKIYMLAAERYEIATRPKGKRHGVLGHIGLEVLREMLRLVDYATGRLDPSIKTLQTRLKRSRPAIVRALRSLRLAGFLDWIRRYEVAPGAGRGRGPQVVQTSNAYRLSLPAIAERLLGRKAEQPPEPVDLAFERAQRAHQSKHYRDQETPIFAAFERWGGFVAKREFTERSESASGSILESRA